MQSAVSRIAAIEQRMKESTTYKQWYHGLQALLRVHNKLGHKMPFSVPSLGTYDPVTGARKPMSS